MAADTLHRAETRDGMHIEWDLPIVMDDGVVLRCDVFRPPGEGRWPVLMSHGPYAKGLAFQDGYVDAWNRMVEKHPDVAAGSSNLYQSWEVVDPEKWVPHGYAVVRVDSRGAGTSEGYLQVFSPRETRDFHDCIEWAAEQPWCDGQVALSGISYYAINQWQVASTQPKGLAALVAWEGAADWYRDTSYHGGILSEFWGNWYDMQVKTVQNGAAGARSRATGAPVCGPELLTAEQLAANRADLREELRAHPLDDAYHRARSPDWSKITVPVFTAMNWGGQGLHPRGNSESFIRAATPDKWFEAHGIEHWTHYYTDYGVALQRRFLDHVLKGTGDWATQPRVQLLVRHPGERFVERHEEGWPIPRTRWTRLHLDLSGGRLVGDAAAGSASFAALGDGLTFLTEPLTAEVELTGPIAARLAVSSSTADADLFLVLRVFAPDLKEVTFQGALDPHTPVAQGWLRASHRALDAAISTPWRPYHTHDAPEPLVPGVPVALDIELWPTSIVVPMGYRIGLSVRGRDYVYPGEAARLSNMKYPMTGCGPFTHDDPVDRPRDLFGGTTTLHAGAGHDAYLLLPVIPPKVG